MAKQSAMFQEINFIASMVLGGVGDAMGYKNGRWEFNTDGTAIHKQAQNLGGVANLELKDWIVSDDTVMAIATAETLIEAAKKIENPILLPLLAKKYVECMNHMQGRAPGGCTMDSTRYIEQGKAIDGYRIPFNPRLF